MDKVFCKDCKFFKFGMFTQTKELCKHHTNVIEEYEDSWYERKIITTYKETPQELNKDNNCKNFEEDEINF
jgi:hypothetical protein